MSMWGVTPAPRPGRDDQNFEPTANYCNQINDSRTRSAGETTSGVSGSMSAATESSSKSTARGQAFCQKTAQAVRRSGRLRGVRHWRHTCHISTSTGGTIPVEMRYQMRYRYHLRYRKSRPQWCSEIVAQVTAVTTTHDPTIDTPARG